ncbi:MAG: hypothetical protein WCP53_13365 [Verrucomicrobiota bacterium]
MIKHSNSFFPGDRVRKASSSGSKVASSDEALVTSADPTSGRLRITYADDRVEWVDMGDVVKLDP